MNSNMAANLRDDVLNERGVGAKNWAVLDCDHSSLERTGCIAAPFKEWLIVAHGGVVTDRISIQRVPVSVFHGVTGDQGEWLVDCPALLQYSD